MAIGIARMFGILLPLNFNSPYKATNIIDFWRRWHMTLSRFLRDYVYISLGGNRKGPARRHINLMITMLLGGLWHGANWTFVAWGGLHGVYLVINHAWHHVRKYWGHDLQRHTWWGQALARVLTLLFVVIAWVFFRADNFSSALTILNAMSGGNGIELSMPVIKESDLFGLNWLLSLLYWQLTTQQLVILVFGATLLFVWAAPNTQQVMSQHQPALVTYPGEIFTQSNILWNQSKIWSAVIATLALWAFLGLSKVSEFLYFQF